MQIVRILFAAIVAVVAMVAGLFTVAFVAAVALVAYAVLLIRGKTRVASSTRSPGPARPRAHRESQAKGDVIDIEASEVDGNRDETSARRD